MAQQVVHSRDEKGGVVLEVSKSVITPIAQRPPDLHLSGLLPDSMVMVDMQMGFPRTTTRQFAADGATSVLGLHQLPVLLSTNPVGMLGVSKVLAKPSFRSAVVLRFFLPVARFAAWLPSILPATVERKLLQWFHLLAQCADGESFRYQGRMSAGCNDVPPQPLDAIEHEATEGAHGNHGIPWANSQVDLKFHGRKFFSAVFAWPVRHFVLPGFLGQFGVCARNSPVLNSLWHKPQGTIMEGLPPGCFAGVFDFMEDSI